MIVEKYARHVVDEMIEADYCHQLILGISLLKAQSSYIEGFDLLYSDGLSGVYNDGIEKLIADVASRGVLGTSLDSVYKRIPDTEKFPEQEGMFAQIAMISLWYLMKYVETLEFDNFLKSIEGYFENKDVENQLSQRPLGDDVLFGRVAVKVARALEEIGREGRGEVPSINFVVNAVASALCDDYEGDG